MKIVCDKCGLIYNDIASIEMAIKGEEAWKKLCKRDNIKARGLCPCSTLNCEGEFFLRE